MAIKGARAEDGRVTPHLMVRGGKKAIEFYARAFAATVLYESPMPYGSGIHAHLQVGKTMIGCQLQAMIVLIYVGVVRSHHVLGLTMLVVLAAFVIWTAPNRWGAGIALHYLSRAYWPDPADSAASCDPPSFVKPSAEE